MKSLKKGVSFILSLLLAVGICATGGNNLEVSAYAPASEYPYSVAAGVYYVDAWNFYQCECTSFVAWCLNARNGVGFHNYYGGVKWSNAKNWKNAAQAIGITVNGNPAVGSVAYDGSGSTGHVAWVTAVNGNGTVNIEEYNNGYVRINGEYHGNHQFNSRTVSTGSFEYIHVQDLPTNQDPTGAVDNIEGGLNTVWVRGWTYDPDSAGANLSVHVYIGGPAGSSSAESFNIGTTNAYRPDVTVGGNSNHGFDASIITSKTGTQPVYVYAINAQGGNNPCIGSGTVTIKSASSSTIIEDEYFIESKIAPKKVLDVKGGSAANTTNVQLFSLGAGGNQVFKIKNENDGFYSIRTECSGYNSGLDVAGISSANRANIAQYEYKGQKNQKWKFFSSGGGYYYIMSGCGSFIDVSKGETTDGTNIATFKYEDNNNLQFKLLKAYSVNYNANGGENAPEMQYKAQGYERVLSSKTPTRDNYLFINWNTEPDGTGTSYDPGAEYSENADVTLYAQWASITHTVAYDANGGENVPDNQIKEFDKSLTITSQRPTRKGYELVNWNTEPNGTGTSYEPGAEYTENADMILYAQWAVKVYTVTYINNDGTDSSSEVTMSGTTHYYLPTPNREGYTCINWNTEPDGTGQAYALDEICSFGNDITLYAQWEAVEFNITLNSGGGTGAPSSITATIEELVSLPVPTREGYALINWNTSSNGNGTAYEAGKPYTFKKKTTLYAQWTRATYKVTFDANGGENAPSPQTKIYNIDLTLTTDSPTLYGHKLQNWNTKADGTGTVYKSGAVYSLNSDITLYAQWKNMAYTITYNANGGFVNPSSVETMGEYMYLIAPTREGYLCFEWNTEPDGTGTSYSLYSCYRFNSDIILYAQWKPIEYTVTYDLKGGSFETGKTSAKVNCGDPIPDDIPQKQDCKFAGWLIYDKKTGRNVNFEGTMPAHDITLIAKWLPADYEAVFYADGVVVSRQTYSIGTDSLNEPEIPAKPYYPSAHWQAYSLENGGNLEINAVYETPKISTRDQRRLNINEKNQINITGNYAVSETKFVSSDKSVATVDDNGVITAIGTGSCFIKVTCKGKDSFGNDIEATTSVTVNVSRPVEDYSDTQSMLETLINKFFSETLLDLLSIIVKFFSVIRFYM